MEESQFIHMAVSGGDCNVCQGISGSTCSVHAQLGIYSLFNANVTITKIVYKLQNDSQKKKISFLVKDS